ncbi:hypothetical protein SMD44_08748 [Streptomyces alboflavus]|uniref:Uncharacterized protein n=1 Tax=Streptomyces alboflavus TaxID=67267 RepID=A0A1Z1WS26_9ACTN|nr:hypothetical protein SMD44_08748 [Streptomyces alboflavus]
MGTAAVAGTAVAVAAAGTDRGAVGSRADVAAFEGRRAAPSRDQ